MRKITTTVLATVLVIATAAHAQSSGGRGGHGGRRGSGSGAPPPAAADAPGPPRQVPLNQVQIIGVVQSIDAPADRITIAYEPVEALNWPAGAMPFAVGKSGLLDKVQVGQKVRFRLESQHIVDLTPVSAEPDPAPGAAPR